MKLIIEIDEETYSGIKDLCILAKYIDNTIKAILDGTPLTEELEKIKAELKGESDFTGAGHLVVEWEAIEKVIDNRISELKGE